MGAQYSSIQFSTRGTPLGDQGTDTCPRPVNKNVNQVYSIGGGSTLRHTTVGLAQGAYASRRTGLTPGAAALVRHRPSAPSADGVCLPQASCRATRYRTPSVSKASRSLLQATAVMFVGEREDYIHGTLALVKRPYCACFFSKRTDAFRMNCLNNEEATSKILGELAHDFVLHDTNWA